MDSETYEFRVQELEEKLRSSENRVVELEGRLKALGDDLLTEAYDFVGAQDALQWHARVCSALEAFGSSLADIQYSRVDPLAVARREIQSWRMILAREVPAILCRNDSPAACIERLCDAFLAIEAGLANVTMVALVEAMKVDVLVYKFEVYRVLMGHSRKDAMELADCRNILLDRWGREQWGEEFRFRFPDYDRFLNVHDRLHDTGIEAVYCFRKGDVERSFDAVNRMEAASAAVWAFLDGIVSDGGEPSVPAQ